MLPAFDHISAWLPDGETSLSEKYENGAMPSEALSQEALKQVGRYLHSRFGLCERAESTLVFQMPDGPEYPGEPDPLNRQFKTLWLLESDDPAENGELLSIGAPCDSDAVVAMLNEVLRFPSAGLMINDERIASLDSGQSITAADLEDSADRISAILVGGWDAMNFLIFERQRGS